MEEITIGHRVPTPAVLRRLAEAVGWGHAFDWDTVHRSPERSLFGVVALDGDMAVGMGRLVGDGALYFHGQDVAVDPGWQGRGVGQAIVETLLDHVRDVAPAGAFVGLFATREALWLYRRYGFSEGDMTGMFRLVHPTRTHRHDT
jgi:GNAT superfamily N-acetyltransferase